MVYNDLPLVRSWLVYTSTVSYLNFSFYTLIVTSAHCGCHMILWSLVSALWQPMPSFFFFMRFSFYMWYRYYFIFYLLTWSGNLTDINSLSTDYFRENHPLLFWWSEDKLLTLKPYRLLFSLFVFSSFYFYFLHRLYLDIQTKNKSANCSEFSWLYSTFLFPSGFLCSTTPSPPHGTTSQSTIRFAAIVFDSWVDFQ